MPVVIYRSLTGGVNKGYIKLLTVNCLVSIDGFTSFYQSLYLTYRVISIEQSAIGT